MAEFDITQLVCRPVEHDDTEAYIALAFEAGHGLVNIPKEPETLQENIEYACQSIRKEVLHPKTERYIFILENRVTGELGGTCGIYAKTGVLQPKFFFRIEQEKRFSEALKQDKTLELLRLVSSSYGPSELVSLYLRDSYLSGGVGRLLSLSRFLFIADQRDRFDSEIIAEMRGVLDDEGNSPFWDCVAGHFTDFTCPEALCMLQHSRHFIPKVLPHYPIYVAMLPHTAQKVMGEVHPHTLPALKTLLGEGFSHTKEIDVFDAGPKVMAPTDSLRLVEHSRVDTVDRIIDPKPKKYLPHIISNRRTVDYRCCLGEVVLEGDDLCIESTVAEALQADVGTSIRFGAISHG